MKRLAIVFVLVGCSGSTTHSPVTEPIDASATTDSALGSVLATPTFSPSGGAVAVGATVTITVAGAPTGTVIHYTLDGTVPSVSSAAYTSPIVLNTAGSVTLDAFALAPGYQISDVASGVFNVGGAGCTIAGEFYSGGVSNPNNACELCQTGVSTTAWTNAVDGTTCGNAEVCASGICVNPTRADAAVADAHVSADANLPTKKHIFVTAGTHDGNFGGVSGADAFCVADSNYPGTGQYKALISDGATRLPCAQGDGNQNCQASENVGWIMNANTEYDRLDGGELGVPTAAGVLSFGNGQPLMHAFNDVTDMVYTGLNSDWTLYDGCSDGDCECMQWTSNSNGDGGAYGTSTDTNNHSIEDATISCDVLAHLYCVEQ